MDIIEPNSQSGKENAAPRQVLDVGLTLRQGRERSGMSVHDVAERTKFAPRQVEALEANDFAHLPQATFLRGFVRSYARVLQLDEMALIAALPGETSKQDVSRAQPVNVSLPTTMTQQRFNLVWLAGALGIGLVLALFLVLHKDEQPVAKTTVAVFEPVPLPAADVAISSVANTEVQPEKAAPVKVIEPEKTIAAPVKVVEPMKKSEPVKVVEPVKKSEPVKVIEPKRMPEAVNIGKVVPSVPEIEAASSPVANTKPALPLEVLMRRPLHFVFAEAMFAEVIDVHGAVLLSKNVPRGAEKWIGGPGRAPYDISISKPGKAKLYFEGKEIDLSAYPATEMAHLKVQ